MSSAHHLAVELETPRPLTVGNQLLISCLWFAFNVQWGALLFIVWPSQVAVIAGPDRKELLNGFSIGLGALVSLVAAPVAGALSDRTAGILGRRRPYLLAGGVLNIVALLFMAGLDRNSTFWVFLLGVFAVQGTANWWGGPYAGLIPDVVPTAQRGEASGYMMLMTVAGYIAGAAASAALLKVGGYRLAYGAIAVALAVLLALTLWRVRERPSHPEPRAMDWAGFLRSFWLDPRQHRDFYWVLVTRGFVTMGIYAISTYLQYYLNEVVRVSNPELLAATLLGVGAAAGLPAALIAGTISDRFGRKRVIYFSGALMAASAVAFAFASFRPIWWLLVGLAAVYGIGYGGYQSVDWALAIDVLPGRADAGKDMGIWHTALVLPIVIAPPMTGIILNSVKHVSLPGAYSAMFLTSAAWFALGTALVSQVKRVR